MCKSLIKFLHIYVLCVDYRVSPLKLTVEYSFGFRGDDVIFGSRVFHVFLDRLESQYNNSTTAAADPLDIPSSVGKSFG